MVAYFIDDTNDVILLCFVSIHKMISIPQRIRVHFNICKFGYRANFIFIQKSKIALAAILEPIFNVGFIHEQGLEVLLEILIVNFIHLKREFIEKRAWIFCVNAFGHKVIKIRYHLFIHVPKEVVNITSFFFVNRFSHATGTTKENSGKFARHKRGHIVGNNHKRELVTVYRPALSYRLWSSKVIKVDPYMNLL